MTLGDILLHMREVSCLGVGVCRRTRMLTDYDDKDNRIEALANCNKRRIVIRHQHDHWMELKASLRVQTEV
jgi:hypothetical protein